MILGYLQPCDRGGDSGDSWTGEVRTLGGDNIPIGAADLIDSVAEYFRLLVPLRSVSPETKLIVITKQQLDRYSVFIEKYCV